MKPNSTGKINMEFTLPDGDWNINTLAYRMPLHTQGPTNLISVVAEPNFLFARNHEKYDINYTITPKNNVIGSFEIGVLGLCGPYIPIVIGLDESKIDPKIFPSPNKGDQFGCPEPDVQTKKIVGYSGIIPTTFSENFTSSIPIGSSLQIPEFPFAILILIISITSLIIFYRIKIRN